MEVSSSPGPGGHRIRGRGGASGAPTRGVSKNKHWTAEGSRSSPGPSGTDAPRWERGGHRGGRGSRGTYRGMSKRFNGTNIIPTASTTSNGTAESPDMDEDANEEYVQPEEPVLDSQEEREKFYKEVRWLFAGYLA
jgi:nuclear mRNA export protein SAC3